ncbi:MAG TPA: response regulator [Dongiaceae bacterium]|jgi:DNA-binding response OmpR family regulator|nr:response regulator [Dongiaceae bacterium]
MAPIRILLVDDEAGVLDLVRTTLETCGYVIDTAASSQEAMVKVRANEYTMVILDLLLPDMNGFLLSQEIRRVRPGLGNRILFISGILFGQSTVEQLGTIGAGFLSKPFQLRALIEAVDKISQGKTLNA